MIKRITLVSIFLCLLIALPLSVMGIRRVEIGTPFLAFMNACSRDLNSFKIAIPEIPSIPNPPNLSGFWAILNAFISFGNFIIKIINVGIVLINVVIELIEFLIIMIKNLITLKDTLGSFATSNSASLPIL